MFTAANTIQNSHLAALKEQAAPRILNAIETASHRTGVDFSYLMQQASAESSFNPEAEAKTSSASGLYQFIESTWMQMVKRYGDEYGLGEYAEKIDSKGKVADKSLRQEILALRKDPQVAAYLAAEFANENAQYLQRNLDDKYGDVGSTELYFAHFMGAGGASAFLNAYKDNPVQTAADLFPEAARANRNVFYDPKTGEPRTLAGVYEFFDKKFGGSDADPVGNNPRIAAQGGHQPHPIAQKRPGIEVDNIYRQIDSQRLVLSGLNQAAEGPVSNGRARRPDFFASQIGLIRHPTEIMLMARLDAPQRSESEQAARRYQHSRVNRYNS